MTPQAALNVLNTVTSQVALNRNDTHTVEASIEVLQTLVTKYAPGVPAVVATEVPVDGPSKSDPSQAPASPQTPPETPQKT